MIISTVVNPTEPHTVFAFLPVMVFDRESGEAHLVWLENVSRKMVSISGTTLWAYSKCEKKVKPVSTCTVQTVQDTQDYVLPWLSPIKDDVYPEVPIEIDEALAFDDDIVGDHPDERFVRVYRNGMWSNPLLFSGNANDYKDDQLVSGATSVSK